MEEFEDNMIASRSKEERMKENIRILQNEILTLKEEQQQNISRLKDDCDKVQVSCQHLIEEQYKVLETKIVELRNKEKELGVLEEECLSLQREHSLEIEKMRKAHQLEIQDIEFDFLKTMTELQNEKDIISRKTSEIEEKARMEIEHMHQFFGNEKLAVINEYEKKIKEVSDFF